MKRLRTSITVKTWKKCNMARLAQTQNVWRIKKHTRNVYVLIDDRRW